MVLVFSYFQIVDVSYDAQNTYMYKFVRLFV